MPENAAYVGGQWRAQCDICARVFLSDQLQLTWDDSWRCGECWEARHPQDFVMGIEDQQNTPWSRGWNPRFTTTSTTNVASTGVIVLPSNLPAVNITGSSTIGGVVPQGNGRLVALTFVDGLIFLSGVVNVFLEGGTYTFKAGDTLFLRCNGTSWFETDRSVT